MYFPLFPALKCIYPSSSLLFGKQGSSLFTSFQVYVNRPLWIFYGVHPSTQSLLQFRGLEREMSCPRPTGSATLRWS